MTRRFWVAFAAILAADAACYTAAFLLRFEFELPAARVNQLAHTLGVVLAVKFVIGLATGEYRRSFRYVSMDDAFWFGVRAGGSAVVLYAMYWTFYAGLPIPRSIILIDALLCFLADGLIRNGYRFLTETVRPRLSPDGNDRVLIYGTDDTALRILRSLPGVGKRFRVVGFVDENVAGTRLIAGVPVVSPRRGWTKLARRFNATRLLISSRIPGRTFRELLEHCAEAGLKAHVIPETTELVDGRYKLGIRDVTISDLLRREPAKLDRDALHEHVTGQRVLVTGAAGSIGSELCRQILALKPASLVLFDQSEFGIFTLQQELIRRSDVDTSRMHFVVGDVTDRVSVARAMQRHEPQRVFHAAAYKHVPLMEDHPHEAIRNNVFGTKCVADLADEFGVERFVLISTDKVVKPSSVMGSTKLVAEKYVQAKASHSQTRFVTVRFGNVLNSAGSVVPIFRSQIEAGGPITVTHPDMVRFFMTIPEAVELVLQAGAIGSTGDVLILDMGEPVRITDLARDMILLSGLRYPEDIDIAFTGMRPGEKLAEELFYGAEEQSRKLHEKIFRGSNRPPQLIDVARDLKRLEATSELPTNEALAVLRDVIASYVAAAESEPSTRRIAA
jgi:FlaA1/EpsC-like NDP-sugar epimerase